MLDRAVTLATEAQNGGLTTAQSTAADKEFQSIVTEIGNIGTATNFNSTSVFSATATNFVVTDGTTAGTTTIATTVGVSHLCERRYGNWWRCTSGSPGLSLSTRRGGCCDCRVTLLSPMYRLSVARIGADINQLNAASNVASSEQVNLSSAQSAIRSTNYGQATSDLAKFQVLSQTGISASGTGQQRAAGDSEAAAVGCIGVAAAGCGLVWPPSFQFWRA